MLFKMKNRKRLRILIIISIFVLLFFNNIYNLFDVINQNSESTDNFNSDYKSLRLANGWPKIHIDNNWSDAKIAGICTGSGTWSDPYVIKDKIIDGGNSCSCILIEHSREYFRIENCTIYNSGNFPNAGIKLIDTNNGTIVNNNCSLNNGYGIYIYESDNNTILRNYIAENQLQGLNVNAEYYSNPPCTNNTISENKFENNGMEAIRISGSNYTIVSKNNITNHNYAAVYISHSDYNTIIGNNWSFNFKGVSLDKCYYSNVSDNIANSNEYGIEVFGYSFYINIKRNNLTNNGCGISNRNCFYGNLTENIILNDQWSTDIWGGISLQNCNNYNLSKNDMFLCGLELEGSLACLSSNTIDKSNKINNKLIYIYMNETGLTSANFSDPGQIILVNCNNSIISNFDLSYCSRCISVHYGQNNTISYNNVSYSCREGIYLSQSYNNTVFKTNASHNSIGVYLEESNNNKILSNLINKNRDRGIYFYGNCNNNTIINNNVTNGQNGITMWNCMYNKIMKNNISNNAADNPYEGNGIKLLSCKNNSIDGNTIKNSTGYGIALENSANNTIFSNKMFKCGIGLSGSNEILRSNNITLNLANNKQIYIYVDKCGLKGTNFSSAGQILLINCNNSMILNQNLSYCSRGIWMYLCNNITMSNITASYNSGIWMYLCNNVTMSNITASYNSDWGISLQESNNNIIINTNSTNNIGGLYLYNCNNNTIVGNSIKNNSYHGIGFYSCNNNTVFGNTIKSNFWYGIIFRNSNNSIIFLNNFINNGINAREDYSINNTWDDDFTGNYWDNYSGPDSDQNGIGDTPYIISGTVGASDTNPLMYSTFEDTDGEGLLNYEEYTLGLDGYRTNVTNPDSDYDGLSDYWEWLNATNPWESDTDFDGMPDLWEVVNLLDPLVNDAMADPDFDDLKNIYEFHNGTNPQNNDTDADSFLDGIEVNKHTNPLNRWWYPMPNLAVIDFEAKAVKEGEPFTLNFTIINNGIWRAENVIIVIKLDLLNQTLYSNVADPIDLGINETYQDLIQCSGVQASGGLVMEIILDPFNFINETYSNQDGSLRANCEGDNSRKVELQITGVPKDGGGIDLVWIIIIIIISVALVAIIGTYTVMRPRFKRKALIKRQVQSAKDDLENFEYNFRSFIKAELHAYYEDKWWEEGIPTYIKNTIENQIRTEKIKIAVKAVDKIDFLDFTHYLPILTDKNNWETIFSKTFSDKTLIEENLEKLRVFKRNLYKGKIIPEEMNNYSLYIHAIRNYFTKGFNIFLSYSTLDADYFKINKIVKKLQSYPEIDKVFFWEADSGENIVTFMERTLKMSKVFILFCSEKSLKSKAVEDEWQAAFQLRKKGLMKIVPVYEKEELIPYLLMPLLNVKFDKDNFEGFIQKLYEEILR